MTGFTVNIEGLDDVIRTFGELPEKVGRRAMRRSLRKGANVIRKIAIVNAKRVDDTRSLNKIYKNISVKGAGAKRERAAGGVMMRVGILGGARDMTKYGEFFGEGKQNPGGDTWYWRLVEFGTSRTAAKPFMRPAMNDAAVPAFNEVAMSLWGEITKELDKLK